MTKEITIIRGADPESRSIEAAVLVTKILNGPVPPQNRFGNRCVWITTHRRKDAWAFLTHKMGVPTNPIIMNSRRSYRRWSHETESFPTVVVDGLDKLGPVTRKRAFDLMAQSDNVIITIGEHNSWALNQNLEGLKATFDKKTEINCPKQAFVLTKVY